MRLLRLLAASVPIAVAACAPAAPLFGGGSLTPRGRVEGAVGGTYSFPLRPARTTSGSLARAVRAGGAAPVGAVRVGVGAGTDLGLVLAGSVARLELRRAAHLSAPASPVRVLAVLGVGPTAGWLPGAEDGGAFVAGLRAPAWLALDAASLVEAWLGGYAEGLYASGTLDDNPARSAGGLRLAAALGLATGFRHLHAGVELTATYERWWTADGGAARGASLVPAAFVRLRPPW